MDSGLTIVMYVLLFRCVAVLPATLAASLNVDSCFIPSLIPSVQVGLTVESAQFHLSNHVHCLGKGKGCVFNSLVVVLLLRLICTSSVTL